MNLNEGNGISVVLELVNSFIDGLINLRIDIFTFVILLLVFALPVEFILRKYTNASVHAHLLSIIRSEKPIPWFDRNAKYKNFLKWFGILGAILGFGVIAADYFWGRGKSLPLRIIINVAAFIILWEFFYYTMGQLLQPTMLIGEFQILILGSFALMGLSGFILSTLFFNGIDILYKLFITQQVACPGVAPLFPGVEIPGVPFSIPVYVWLLFFPMLIIHEAFHGLLARLHKISVKSTGIVFLSFLPFGAFVDLNEKEMEKLEGKKSLQILSSGAFSNVVTFILVGVFAILFVFPFITPPMEELSTKGAEALLVDNVDENTTYCGDIYQNSAFGIIEEGDILLELNGQQVMHRFDYQDARSLDAEAANLKYLDVSEDSVKTNTFEYNELGLIGIQVKEKQREDYVADTEDMLNLLILQLIGGMIGWFMILNFLIGAANYLPIVPFDGGRMAKILFAPYLGFLNMPKDHTERLVGRLFLWALLIILAINLLPIFFTG